MSSKYILLWLEGPLQAWGHDSRFGARHTLDFPTRSGVLGLICCALGEAEPSPEWLARWEGQAMQVLAYTRQDKQGLAHRDPQLQDFHMVGSGYDDEDEDPWQCLRIPKTSEGKKAVGGGAKMTYRHYLQGMAFGVVLQVPEDLAAQVKQGLCCPVWPIYLGRKSCPPTEWVFQGTYGCPDIASGVAKDLAKTKGLALAFEVKEGRQEGAEQLVLCDVPVTLGRQKSYRDRVVSIVTAPI